MKAESNIKSRCSGWKFSVHFEPRTQYLSYPENSTPTFPPQLHSKTLIRSSKLALAHMKPMLILLPLHMLQNTYNSLDYTMEEEFLTRSFGFKFLYLLAGFWTFKWVRRSNCWIIGWMSDQHNSNQFLKAISNSILLYDYDHFSSYCSGLKYRL